MYILIYKPVIVAGDSAGQARLQTQHVQGTDPTTHYLHLQEK